MIMKRVPIQKRIRRLIMLVSSVSMILIALAAVILMFGIKHRSEEYILSNLEDSVMNSLDDIAILTELELNEYANQVLASKVYVESLFEKPNLYLQREIGVHQHFTDKDYCFRKYYASEMYKKEELNKELELLSNVESFWTPLFDIDNDNIASIYLGTETGLFLSYDKEHLDNTQNNDEVDYFNYFTRAWYLKAKREGRLIFTDIDLDWFGRGLTLTCAAPFYKEDKFVGVVALDILVDDIQKNMISIDAGPGSYSFAIDKHGNIIASPNLDESKTQFDNIRYSSNELNGIAEKMLSGQAGIEQINDSYYVYAPIENVEWVICVKIPKTIITAPAKRIDRNIINMIISFVTVALIVLTIVYFISKSFAEVITKPIEKLKNDVEVISKGHLDYKAEMTSNDEISDLANSFNEMTTSLKTYIDDVTSLTAEKERTGTELNIATKIQVGMLPSNFDDYNGDSRFEIYATMNPAKEVGGDFYDFFKVDDQHIAIVVADVSGKGIPAALFMAIGKTLIKDHSNIQRDLPTVFSEVNNILCEANRENLFITAFEGIIDLTTGAMIYVNAGHEMPFIYQSGKSWEAQRIKPGFVLGGMDNIKYTLGEFKLEPGDKFFEYTDGVTEATNSNNELYGMDRLKVALDKNVDKKMCDLLSAVKADIDGFVGEAPQFDDITMLGFEYKGV